MNSDKTFQQVTGVVAILAGILAWGSIVIGLSAVDYNFDVFSDTSSLIAIGAAAAQLIQWSHWLNMFGNYLMLIPLALFLYQWLKPTKPEFAQLFMVCGLFYILLGAAGSAILAEAWPYLIVSYEQVAAAEHESLIIQFQVVNTIAEQGLQGIIQNSMAFVWFFGMGYLIRSKQNALGIFTMVLGFFLLLNAAGNIFDIELLSLLGLTVNILVGPLWAILMGVLLVSKKI